MINRFKLVQQTSDLNLDKFSLSLNTFYCTWKAICNGITVKDQLHEALIRGILHAHQTYHTDCTQLSNQKENATRSGNYITLSVQLH